jgi:uncharacterized membrane protein
MKPNLNEKERLYRTIFGVYGMLLGFFFLQGVIGIILGILSLISLVTGLTGWCAIYYLTGKSTLEVTSSVTNKEQNDVD